MTKSRLVGPLGFSLRKRFSNEERGFGGLGDDIDSYIDAAPCSKFENEVETAFRIALRALVNRYKEDSYFSMEYAIKICESPIEGMMLATFILLSAEKQISLQIQAKDLIKKFPTSDSFPKLTITPQARIGDYRSDFLLDYEDIVPDFENEIVTKQGVKIPASLNVKSKLLVECDGHDFHEKTKEQARRDKQRDRTLQSSGFFVFRFTGSEIYKDPIKCADEVFSQLEKVNI